MTRQSPIQILAIDHIVLRTSKLQKMLTFYQDILACPIERELPELGLTQLRAGNALIDIVTVESELGQLGGKAPEQNGRNVDHFCLQTAAFDEQQLRGYLEAHNIATNDFEERYGAQGFGRSIYIEDPEGNIVELKPQL
ncbi:methylmalonyl CoA epimerase [Vibrio orientalis CIP 102891 = ATCC 33934]|uniref:Lactoylglutathione lyase n=1 Tax=Vibrio orientalis CIP 102891 = ATCC 33934 TaxID=675816 RepID=C9QJ37_VIBOR|nr:VOC family protein [Vibrio orientalis]EEX91587.1 lactoylglutathione lyase [Vibrio orientalis CIP 102891 = ATCC 33934]EGU47190.1 methylmalonyl CoA epimerase [Vibrio orientalis CIP 102891 = ATCC 33934]